MRLRKAITLILLALLFSPSALWAQSQSSVAVSAGSFNYDKDSVSAYGIEYRAAPSDNLFGISSFIGIEGNADGAYWLFAGGRYEFKLSSRWSITPHLALSYYEQGDSVDLGGSVQFRSGVDLNFRLTESTCLFLGYHHQSNAGLEEHNPGANAYMIGVSFSF